MDGLRCIDDLGANYCVLHIALSLSSPVVRCWCCVPQEGTYFTPPLRFGKGEKSSIMSGAVWCVTAHGVVALSLIPQLH